VPASGSALLSRPHNQIGDVVVITQLLDPHRLRHGRSWVLALFIGALVLRLSVLAVTFKGNDAVLYYDDAQIALNILGGHGYSVTYQYRNWLLYESVLTTTKLRDPVVPGFRTTALKQPLNALILTGMFAGFGEKNFLAVFLLHALISSATVCLLFLSLRRTAPQTALLLSIGAAAYPSFVVHTMTVPESTTLILFLIAALWYWMTNPPANPSWTYWGLGGTIGGLAVLTEPVMSPFVGLTVCLAAALSQGTRKVQLLSAATAIVVASIVVSPWLARNYVVFDRFPVLKSGSFGHIFNWGLHFSGKGSWISEERLVALEQAGRQMSELEEEEAIARELRAQLPKFWLQYATYDIPHHFLHLWWDVPRYWNNYSLSYLLGRRLPYVVILIFALPEIAGLISRLWRRSLDTVRQEPVKVSALILFATTTAVYSIFGAFHSRYRLPLELGLLVFAASTLQRMVHRGNLLEAEPAGR
jgi:4-amino-4-deoxy-L-arabinose transferase-like glycosyltransferase